MSRPLRYLGCRRGRRLRGSSRKSARGGGGRGGLHELGTGAHRRLEERPRHVLAAADGDHASAARMSGFTDRAYAAGFTAAYWLRRHGFTVTVVERAPALRRGGQAVHFRGPAMTVLDRMGLLDQGSRYVFTQSTRETFDALAEAASQPAIHERCRQWTAISEQLQLRPWGPAWLPAHRSRRLLDMSPSGRSGGPSASRSAARTGRRTDRRPHHASTRSSSARPRPRPLSPVIYPPAGLDTIRRTPATQAQDRCQARSLAGSSTIHRVVIRVPSVSVAITAMTWTRRRRASPGRPLTAS
jgi:hypothetical protein